MNVKTRLKLRPYYYQLQHLAYTYYNRITLEPYLHSRAFIIAHNFVKIYI